MSGDLGSLVISLTAETAQFKDALTKSAYQMDQSVGQMVSSVNNLQTSFGRIDSVIGAFGVNLRNVLGLGAAGAFAGLIANSIEAAGNIHDMSEKTGIAAGEIAAMRGAAAEGGVTLDVIAQASAKFSKSIETQNEDTGAAAQALSALGLSMEEVKTHSPAEQLHMVAERMNTFADGSGKAAAAQVLFGKSGTELIPFLKAYGDQVDINTKGYNRFAAQADQFGDSMSRLRLNSQLITEQYAMAFLPTLIKVVDGLDRFKNILIAGAVYYAALPIATIAATSAYTALTTAMAANSIAAEMGMAKTNLLTTSLWGTSAAATATSGALGALSVAGGVLFAAFAGWQIGSWLTEQFVEARLAGIAFVEGTLVGWEHIKYAAGVAWEGIKALFSGAINIMREDFADFIGNIGKGFAAIGAGDTARAMASLAESIRPATSATAGFAAAQKTLADERDRAIAGVKDITSAMADDAIASDQAKNATVAHAKAKVNFAEATDKARAAAAKWLDTLKDNIAKLGLTEEAVMRLQAREKGLGDTADALIKKFVDTKAALEAQKKATEETEAAVKKHVDAQIDFRDKLVDNIGELGRSEEATLKLRARQLDLGDSTDSLIAQYIAAKEAMAQYAKAVEDAKKEHDAYVGAVETTVDRTANAVLAWRDGNRALQDQIDTIGLTKTEIERLAAMHVYEADVQKAQLIENQTVRESFLEYLRDEYQKRLALINSAEMKQAYVDAYAAAKKAAEDAAAAARKAYEDSANAINKSLVDAIMGGFSAGKSLAEQFKNTLIDMFKNLVLRPILQPVSNYMAGLFQQGQTAVGGFFGAGTGLIGGTSTLAGGGDYAPGENPTSFTGSMGAGYGGWGGILAGAALGGAIGSQYGSKNPIYGSIAGAGAMVGLAGATGVAATGIAAMVSGTTAAAVAAGTASTAAAASFATVAAAVPVIGWIVAAIALIASFAVKPGGGPKVGSFQSANYEDGMVTSRSGWNSSGGGDNSAMNSTINAFNASYIGYVKALGGKLIDQYSIHSLYETDPQGTASSYGMFIMAKPGQGVPGNGPGQSNVATIDAYYNSGKFDPTAANFELYASRALLAAVQQSQLPADVAKLLDSLIPNALSSAQISNVLAYASAFRALPQVIKDALDGITGLEINPETSINLAKFGAAYSAVQKIIEADPGADVATMLEEANQTQIEKFRAQGDALRKMAAQFDGSADSALALAQATAQYYQNQIQLLAALEQSSAQFHKSIQDAQRSIQFQMLGGSSELQQEFYKNEIAANMAKLADAAANPASADPAQVAAWAERARADYQAWFNMLDQGTKDNLGNSITPNQQVVQGQTFIDYLNTLDAQLAAANKAIADNIKAQNDPNNPASPIGQVKGAFDKFLLDMGKWLEDNRAVATDTSSAANTMAAAADKMDAAGAGMLTAANTPARIDLTWNGSEVTAGGN